MPRGTKPVIVKFLWISNKRTIWLEVSVYTCLGLARESSVFLPRDGGLSVPSSHLLVLSGCSFFLAAQSLSGSRKTCFSSKPANNLMQRIISLQLPSLRFTVFRAVSDVGDLCLPWETGLEKGPLEWEWENSMIQEGEEDSKESQPDTC